MEKAVESPRQEKPGILFILTGLGRYSWYTLPFLRRHTFCAGLPRVIAFCIGRLFQYKHGSCRCQPHGCSCKWIGVFGLTVGLCEEARELKSAMG
jgi:hypothetical protein